MSAISPSLRLPSRVAATSIILLGFLAWTVPDAAHAQGAATDSPSAATWPCRLLSAPISAEEGIPRPLTIGYRADAKPFSYTDDGRPAGYTVALCREIAQALVGEDNIRFRETTALSRFDDLAAKRIDLLCDSSTLTLQRAACFDHTLLTFPSGPALAELPVLPGRPRTEGPVRVGVLSRPSSTANRAHLRGIRRAIARELRVEEVEMVEMDSYTALFEAMTEATGRPPQSPSAADPVEPVQALFADREILLAHAERTPGVLIVRDAYFSYEPYTIYLRPNRELRVRADAALTAVFSSPVIHRLLNESFTALADTVGQLIKLQRIPPN